MLIAETIATKWTRAEKAIKETEATYRELTSCLDSAWIDEWTQLENIAMQNRGDDLKIYQVSLERGISFLAMLCITFD